MSAKLAGGELTLRIASAFLLAPLAVGVAYVGGWTFVAFWAVVAILVLWEWTVLVMRNDRQAVLLVGGASVLLAAILAGDAGKVVSEDHETRLFAALAVLAIAMIGTMVITHRRQPIFTAAGIPYAGALAVAPSLLRSDAQYGFPAMIFLFAIVWTTDISAYFVGRLVGGPKLAPHISPKKTWSGAIGGTAVAVAVAAGVALLVGLRHLGAVTALAAVLSMVSQAGDLFESGLKRRFGAKDSSHLIPGHGGLMDRLDAFVAAAVLAALVGIGRGGLEAPARGLLVW